MGLLWPSVRPVAETSTWQHKTLTRDRHPWVGFEPAVPINERPQTHASDRADTGIGMSCAKCWNSAPRDEPWKCITKLRTQLLWNVLRLEKWRLPGSSLRPSRQLVVKTPPVARRIRDLRSRFRTDILSSMRNHRGSCCGVLRSYQGRDKNETSRHVFSLTLILLTWRIGWGWAHNNARK